MSNPKPNEKTYCQVCRQPGSEISITRIVSHTFNNRLREILTGENKNFEPLDLGCPSDKLMSGGIPNLPIQISVKKLMGKKAQENHPFSLADIICLPEYLCHPIAVFRSASTVEDIKVVLTEMECNQVNILVIIAPFQNYRGYDVNDIRSIYAKDNIKAILNWVKCGLAEYADKQKFLNWLGKHQSISDEVTRLIKDCTKVVNEM